MRLVQRGGVVGAWHESTGKRFVNEIEIVVENMRIDDMQFGFMCGNGMVDAIAEVHEGGEGFVLCIL